MADGITGSVEYSCGTYYKLRIRYHEIYDSDGNYSIFHVDGVDALSAKGGSKNKAYYPDGKIIINGTTVKTLDSRNPDAEVFIENNDAWYTISNTACSLRVDHDVDGKKTISVGVAGNRFSTWKMYTLDGSGGSGWGTTASVNVALTTILRLSTISCGTFTMGSSGRINISKLNSSFKHTIEYYWGDTTAEGINAGRGYKGTVADKTPYDHVDWIPPDYLANLIPNETSGVGTLVCNTIADGVVIGTSKITFRANVPEYTPSISSFVAEIVNNSVPSSWGLYVQEKSQCKLKVVGSGKYGSTIRSYSINRGSSVLSSASEATTGVLIESGNITFTAYVTDSRGKTASKDVTISVTPYSAPVINSVLSQRCNSDGTLNGDGTHIRCVCSFTIASCSGKNSGSGKVKFKHLDGSWSSEVPFTSGNAVVIGGNVDIDNSYEVYYEVSDALTQGINQTDVVSTAFTTMDFKKGGKGVAIGKASEKECFECAMDAEFTGSFSANLSGLFVRETFVPDSPVSVNPNAVNDTVLNIAKEGYTPIAISGVHTSHGSALLVVAQLVSSTQAKVTVRNVNANAINVAPSAEILFLKNI